MTEASDGKVVNRDVTLELTREQATWLFQVLVVFGEFEPADDILLNLVLAILRKQS